MATLFSPQKNEFLDLYGEPVNNMKSVIKNLLTELTSMGKTPIELVLFKKSQEVLGNEELLNLKGWLLQWHKKIKGGFPSDDFKENYFNVSEVLYPGFAALFNNCPELSDLYELKESKVLFNSSLSAGEKKRNIELCG